MTRQTSAFLSDLEARAAAAAGAAGGVSNPDGVLSMLAASKPAIAEPCGAAGAAKPAGAASDRVNAFRATLKSHILGQMALQARRLFHVDQSQYDQMVSDCVNMFGVPADEAPKHLDNFLVSELMDFIQGGDLPKGHPLNGDGLDNDNDEKGGE